MPDSLNYKPIGSVGTRSGGLDVLAPTRVRLYLGADHLLLVEKSLVRETYQRLYFRDLQAVAWTTTRVWIWKTLLLGLFFLPLAAGAVAARNTGAEYILGGLAGLVFLLTLVNLRQGRSCRVFVKTPAQYAEIPCLTRVKEVQRFLTDLRPLIQQHQAPIAPATAGLAPDTASPAT
jgi:hypothetical protein